MNFVELLRESIFVDRRSFVNKKREVRKRSLSVVDSLVLHQTAFNRGSNHSSYDKLGVHFVILPDGTILQLYDATSYLHASNRFNARSVAVEFVGNFPNENGDWWTGHGIKARNMPSKKQIYNGRKLINFLRRSLDITHVFAHRQANKNKSNCPGPHIWNNVGEWAIRNGFSDGGQDYCLTEGRAIPAAWRDHEHDLLNTSRLIHPFLTQ